MRTSPSSRAPAVVSVLIVGLFVASALTAIGADRGAPVSAGPARSSGTSGVAPLVTSPYNLTLDPVIFSTYYASNGTGIASTVVVTNGATFGSGFTVDFCVSTSETFNGPPSQEVGSIVLNAGQTALANTLVTFSDSQSTILDGAGTYYIAATDSVGGCGGGASSYTNATKITTTTVAPTLAFTSPDTVGATDAVSGAHWGANATLTLHLNNLTGRTLATLETNAEGNLTAGSSFVVPTLPYTPSGYTLVAQETAPTGGLYGISVARAFQIESNVSATPFFFSGKAGMTLDLTGTGFAAGATIAKNSITVAGVATSHAAVTTASSGGFNVTVTMDTSIPLSPGGYESVGITTSPGSSRTTFPDRIFVSSPSPGSLQFTLNTSSVVYGSSILARAWNFPAGASLTFFAGSTVLGTVVASSLGFAQLVTTFPAMPAGTYDAYAADAAADLVSPTVSVTVNPRYSARDPTGFSLPTTAPTEYVPSNGTIGVQAYGLSPATGMTFTDTVWTGVVAGNSIGLASSQGYAAIAISVGSLNASTGVFTPAPNGTLAFAYLPDYARIPSLATGTLEEIGNASVAFGSYATVTAPDLSSIAEYAAFHTGTDVTITISNLIPQSARLYPGSTADYNVLLGATVLSGLTGSTCPALTPTVCYGAGTPAATLTLKFAVPIPAGLLPLTIRYNGSTAALASVSVLVSLPGAAPGDGTLEAVVDPVSHNTEIVGFDLFPSTLNYTLYVSNLSTSAGVDSTIAPAVGPSGALGPIDISSPVAYTSEPAGTYAVYLLYSNATTSASVSTTYTVALGALDVSPGSGPVGDSVVVSTTGLDPGSYYDVYLGSALWVAGQSSSNGSFAATGSVPRVAEGTYTISLDPAGSTSPVESAPFSVTGTVSLVTAGTDQLYAFPGELVDFAWDVANAPPPSTFPFTVTVLLNGSAYETEAGILNGTTIEGSFTMPNACPGSETSCGGGSYWWVTLNWSQVYGGRAAGYNDTDPAFLELVSGNGALVLSVTPTDIAEIATLTGQDVNVTLEALDAKISGVWASGNTTYAQLATDFGDMNVSLATLSAKVSGVWASGNTTFVQLKTDFGDVNVTLADLSGKISSVWASGNTTFVQLKTDFGDVNVTLAALSAKVSGVWASGNTTFVQLKTDFGDLNVTLASLSAKVSDVWASGNTTYAQLKTDVGDLNVTLASLGAKISGVWTSGNTTLVELKSDIGDLNATLASLGAKIADVWASGNTTDAELKTDFGDVNVTLADLSASVTTVVDGNAKIETSLGNVTASLKAINATVNSIESTSLTLSTTLGEVHTTLNAVNANLSAVRNDVLELTTAVGDLNLSVASLNATLTLVNGTVFTISTNLGRVEASLTSVATTVTAINSSTNSLLGSTVIVKTDLGDLLGTVDLVNGNVTTVETGIGQLLMSTAAIQAAQGSQPTTGDLNGVADLVYVSIALIAVTLALALLLFLGWTRRRGGTL